MLMILMVGCLKPHGRSFKNMVWITLAFAWQKMAGRSETAAALKAETPEGEPAAIGLGVHIPFGPMLAIAGALHFLFFRAWVDERLADFLSLF